MTYYDFEELVGDLTPEQRARVEAIKEETCAEIVAYNLKELRLHRNLTQTELARRLDRAQASVSAMESAADNLVSTLRMAVEGMGGSLEVTAVFDDEQIPLTTHTRTSHREGGDQAGPYFLAMPTHTSLREVEELPSAVLALNTIATHREGEERYSSLLAKLLETLGRAADPSHVEEQRAAERLLAELELSFQESEDLSSRS